MNMTQQVSNRLSQHQLGQISKRLFEKATDLLDLFEIEYEELSNRITFACPIHGGDNTTALTIFTEGDTLAGNWCCWTHNCEATYKNTMIGFVRGVLSYREGSSYGFFDTIKFCLDFLDCKLDSIKDVPQEKDKDNFIRSSRILTKEKKEQSGKITREKVRKDLDNEVQYYTDRGYLSSTLDKFDVGICNNPDKMMYGRIVVPIYDDDHKYMIGCIGRSQCETVKPKWIHSKGFRKSSCLYNYWYSKKYIAESETVVLVEGQGDIWRLDEAGIYNAVGIFGCSLSDEQLIILERSGALNLVLLMDNDEAGSVAKNKIKEQCGRLFNIRSPEILQKEVGDMSVEEVKSIIEPHTK